MPTHRILGGVPAGTNIRPGELGCLTTKMRMRMTTKLGNKSRNPSGTDMEEFPFNLIRLRKKDRRGDDLDFDFSVVHSSGEGGDEAGRRFNAR